MTSTGTRTTREQLLTNLSNLADTAYARGDEPRGTRWAAAWHRINRPRVKACPTTTPEPHEAGEFPMSCYRCHMVADG